MVKTIAQRELRTRNGEPVAELWPVRSGRGTFISREEVAALAAAGVRIDRHLFRTDLDRSIDQTAA